VRESEYSEKIENAATSQTSVDPIYVCVHSRDTLVLYDYTSHGVTSISTTLESFNSESSGLRRPAQTSSFSGRISDRVMNFYGARKITDTNNFGKKKHKLKAITQSLIQTVNHFDLSYERFRLTESSYFDSFSGM